MAVPTWSVGQVLASSDLNNWMVPLVGYRTSDLSITANTTPANDAQLFIPLAANAVYHVTYVLSFACAANSVNITVQFTIPSGASGFNARTYQVGASTQTVAMPDSWTQARTPYIDNTRDWGMTGAGTIFTSSTAANLQLQWAQGTSSGTATIMRKGSVIIAQRMG